MILELQGQAISEQVTSSLLEKEGRTGLTTPVANTLRLARRRSCIADDRSDGEESAAKLLRFAPLERRAGEGNRTLVCSLEGYRSTIELHPRQEEMVRGTRRKGKARAGGGAAAIAYAEKEPRRPAILSS